MREIKIEEEDELEFNLNSIGIENTLLVLRGNKCFLYNSNFYTELPKEFFEPKQGELILIDEDNERLIIKEDQLEYIKEALNTKF